MGFVGVMKFVVKCIDVLAWPLFALVYPLCASIRAIEIGSSSDIRKLVAYWVLFSLLFLFEYSFVKLLEWIPFWLYIKLIISCWLVIPNFDGAFYVYNHFLRPCLYTDPKVLINRLKGRKEFFFKKNEFELEVKKCGKENGPEASKGLFVGKVKLQIANCVQDDVTTVEEITERKDAAAAKKVDPTEPDVARTEKYNFAPKKIQEISESVAPCTEIPEVPVFPNNFRKDICPLFQGTAYNETTWNAHIQGQRNVAALEKLKAKKLKSKKAACEPSKTKVAHASEDKSSALPVEGPVNNAGSSKRDQKLEQEVMKNEFVQCRGPKWWCTICNASCTCVQNMESHLKGSKHLAKVRELNVGS